MFRSIRLLAVLLLVAPAAFAQPAPEAGPAPEAAPPPAAAPQGAPGGHMSPREKFEAANTTHDGRLTIEQARAGGMRGVVRNFAGIDADHKGYVTLQDIQAWHRAQHAARLARQSPPASPTAPQ